MKCTMLITLVLSAVLNSTAFASDPVSPLYAARLAETLDGWESGPPLKAEDAGEATWWPVSLNPLSLCIGSACPQSYCFGSLCAESLCLGSGCLGSTCIGSGCLASLCGVSGCLGATLCIKKCGYNGGLPNAIDPTNNGTTFTDGHCYDR